MRLRRPATVATRNVTDMSRMFSLAESFDQPVNFDTRKVINVILMFYRARAFNQPVDFAIS